MIAVYYSSNTNCIEIISREIGYRSFPTIVFLRFSRHQLRSEDNDAHWLEKFTDDDNIS